jgi:peptidoglycan-associated lipoprotein
MPERLFSGMQAQTRLALSRSLRPWKGNMMERSLVSLRAARLAAVLIAGLALAACSNTPKPEDQLGANGAGGVGGRGIAATPGSAKDFSANVGDIVYFSTDQTDLSPEAQQTLANQARWLQQYSQYTITIEGHADERGTREYNIGLGSKRSTSVKEFLSRNGVQAARIRTISYGKERPVAVCNDISCWSQNRRAQTVLNARGGGVAQAN